MSHPILGIKAGNVCVCKPQICWNTTLLYVAALLLYVHFSISCWDVCVSFCTYYNCLLCLCLFECILMVGGYVCAFIFLVYLKGVNWRSRLSEPKIEFHCIENFFMDMTTKPFNPQNAVIMVGLGLGKDLVLAYLVVSLQTQVQIASTSHKNIQFCCHKHASKMFLCLVQRLFKHWPK